MVKVKTHGMTNHTSDNFIALNQEVKNVLGNDTITQEAGQEDKICECKKIEQFLKQSHSVGIRDK